jgi:hypothetical protein
MRRKRVTVVPSLEKGSPTKWLTLLLSRRGVDALNSPLILYTKNVKL